MNTRVEDLEESIEAGVTAASEEIDATAGLGRRWRQWGTKEMLIATTAATVAVAKWRRLREDPNADITS